ncbi:uncharacterized protein LOC119385211 [Rhipicephalus sanguineus]|uniref:uncharacterized protein LOC119385211 n=1 Tax=Rhipicephalus sanguineus TaxID=34632 RepID=UPI0020C42F7A|nr:uncharacterized protein LOC119385211 [Rhipicephalus sanguineus]
MHATSSLADFATRTMRTTTLWILLTMLAIGSWSLKHDDMKEYASEHPIPKEGISALDIYQDKGAVPKKINEVDKPSLEQSVEEKYDYYDDCDNYYDDENSTYTLS